MPGTDTQVHDFNARIHRSGLFWTVPIPEDAVDVNRRTIRMHIEDLKVVDSTVFLGSTEVPARVSFDVTWRSTSDKRHIEPGSTDPTDPTNFQADLRFARATGTFSARTEGFRFRRASASSDDMFAEFGKERNGVFLNHSHVAFLP